MGEQLLEQWHLAVLRVSLDLSERTPAVVVELVGYPKGRIRRFWWCRYALEEFGLSGGTDPPSDPRVPEELPDAVTGTLDKDFGQEAVLWLRLVRPYGYLGAVPWEAVLVAASGRPLIRVPNWLPLAADPGHAWSLAVALNAAPGSSWAAPYLVEFLAATGAAVSAPVEADIFVDAETFETMTSLISRWPDEMRVHLHDPGRAGMVHTERTRQEVSQFRRSRRAAGDRPSSSQPGGLVWADWIATGLEGRAVRALHLVGDAAFDQDRPLLAISLDPAYPAERAQCTYVTADGAEQLANTIGASLLSFGSPPGNPCGVATRVMADSVGQQRPGPTLCSSIQLDPGGHVLAQAHAFVANPPGLVPIPRDPSLFAYLQLEHVRASLQEHWLDPGQPGQGWLTGRTAAPNEAVSSVLWPTLAPSPSDAVTAHYASADSVPGWVAASERYIDATAAHLVETVPTPDAAPPARQAYDRGTAQALAELRELVERNVREQ